MTKQHDISAKMLEALSLATTVLAEAYRYSMPGLSAGASRQFDGKTGRHLSAKTLQAPATNTPPAPRPTVARSSVSIATETGGCGRIVRVYCAGAPGFEALAKAQACSIFKIGSTSGSTRSRIAELAAIGYASQPTPSGRADPGFDNWRSIRIVARPSANPAITVLRQCIEVRLPPHLTVNTFETRLREKLLRWNLDPETALASGAIRPMSRWTRRPRPERPCRATELYRFRPREDGDRLVHIVEVILEDAPEGTFDRELGSIAG